MKRFLLQSKAFVRAAKKIVKKKPEAAQDIQTTLEMLANDCFDSRLQTH